MENIVIKRMLSEKEGMEYTGLGRTKFRQFGNEIGAIHHVGKRVLYDKSVIDSYFDKKKES